MADINDDFFLPDLCEANSILFLVLVAELLVLVVVLLTTGLFGFDWAALGLTSLFVQWVVLTSAAILCNLRPWLSGMSTPAGTVVGFSLILVVTLIFSVAAEWLVDQTWGREQWGVVLRNLLVAAVMAGIAFRYFFLQHRLRRQEQAELNSRIQALQSRIRPHFLFNSMNIVASLIAIDPDTAEQVIEDLSELFRASLSDSRNEVPLRKELDLCKRYVHIESLRLDDRLEVQWDVHVDQDLIRIPMLTLQPVIENAIYHGIQPNPEGGVVVVHVETRDGMLRITVRNPRAENAPSHEKGNRMALDNIRRRLEALHGDSASITANVVEDAFETVIVFPMQA